MTKTAKLFWTGRSQAVRLPKEFRMDGEEVRIRKQGSGRGPRTRCHGLGVARFYPREILGRFLGRRPQSAAASNPASPRYRL